jgi:hypothetical protein
LAQEQTRGRSCSGSSGYVLSMSFASCPNARRCGPRFFSSCEAQNDRVHRSAKRLDRHTAAVERRIPSPRRNTTLRQRSNTPRPLSSQASAISLARPPCRAMVVGKPRLAHGSIRASPLVLAPGFLSVVASPDLGFRRLAHFALATSAALMPSNASPYPTPSSMIRRSF